MAKRRYRSSPNHIIVSYGFWAAQIPTGYLKLFKTAELVLHFDDHIFNRVTLKTERRTTRTKMPKKKKTFRFRSTNNAFRMDHSVVSSGWQSVYFPWVHSATQCSLDIFVRPAKGEGTCAHGTGWLSSYIFRRVEWFSSEGSISRWVNHEIPKLHAPGGRRSSEPSFRQRLSEILSPSARKWIE